MDQKITQKICQDVNNSSQNQHWTQMNCVLNPEYKESSEMNAFYISEKGPPNFILSDDIQCIIYHPLHLDGQTGSIPDERTKQKIIDFIRINDCTDSGNITELSLESLERLFSTPTIMAVLFSSCKYYDVIGTMITPIFRAQYKGTSLLTSYTTFLCVNKFYRDRGLAMVLIRAVMKEGYDRYGINHGYYMTFQPHHSINNEIKSWYRPINIKKSIDSGFTLQLFPCRDKRGNSNIRQRLAYYIPKPSVLPVKATPFSYDLILQILNRGEFHLNPTRQHFEWLCKCFDIYTVGNDSLFMLFPMISIISSTNKKVRNAQVALMIGDVLPHALWIASEEKYDLLYGWCGGDITPDKVSNIKGLITVARSYLELYNTRVPISNNNMMVPIF